jgi:hypothetical protein
MSEYGLKVTFFFCQVENESITIIERILRSMTLALRGTTEDKDAALIGTETNGVQPRH